ncbi:hypothetical protein [Leptolyngbya sp. BL0902]|uniref:hypothetical protein n=1 Tax=Leptolyngbya sp. BL0902 TaxID=1115757 RepID=UPI0018E8C25D|nr:hypothetical protein [Leptolyngbya sp. BL0902]
MTQNEQTPNRKRRQDIAADSLDAAAAALSRSDTKAAVEHIERAKQLLEESSPLDLASTSAD